MRRDASASRSRLLHGGIVALAMLAAAAFCIADADGNVTGTTVWLTTIAQCVATASAAVYFRRLKSRSPESIALSPILLAVMVGSYLWEPIGRWTFGFGRPFETLVIFSLKNVMLAMAAVSCWRYYSVWALFSSLFVVMFSAALTTSATVQVIVAVYAVGAVAWLMIAYWESLRSRLIATDQQKLFSRRWIALGLTCAVVLLATVSVGDNQALSSLQGWMPSSGGTGEFDPFSRNGVGDGEALVAGTDNITSFAPIDDAPFLQDDQPSLYDIFDDTYEDPKPPKQQDRTVGLPPEMASRIKEHLHTRTQKASREFSTLRQSTERGTKVKDIRSDALFYVSGRTPLHLRLEVFDLFDGITWYAEPDDESPKPIKMTQREGRSWVEACQFSQAYECFWGPESHAIKVVRLDTSRIPAPLHLTGVHIADVDRADMFGWAQKDVMQMERERLPALVPIHLTSAVLDRSAVEASHSLGLNRPEYRSQVTSAQIDRIEALARSWVETTPIGWPQVLEIERRLREEYVHDRDLIVESEDTWPVTRFLFDERRGPDYQFATAAAVMLRSLGYSTRVVSGFYVDPEKYDLRSRHTPVHKDDVHFWVEVYLGAHTWATVEPTPGYAILQPPPGLLACAWMAVWGWLRWATANVVAISLCLMGLTALFAFRLHLQDMWHTLRWRMRPVSDRRSHVVATWKLIDWRIKSCGIGRANGQTAVNWLQAGEGATVPFQEPLQNLVALVEWASFAPDHTTPADDLDVAECCRSAVQEVTRTAIRRTQPAKADWTARTRSLLVDFRRTLSSPAKTTQMTNG